MSTSVIEQQELSTVEALPKQEIAIPGLSDVHVQLIELGIKLHGSVTVSVVPLYARDQQTIEVTDLSQLAALPAKKLEIAVGHIRREYEGIL